MSSNDKCIYCQEIVYPGLNFQKACGNRIESIIRMVSMNVPLFTKGKLEVASRQRVQYRARHGDIKSYESKTYKRGPSERVNKGIMEDLMRHNLKSPLCYDCMMEFLIQAANIFEDKTFKGKKKRVESSMSKIQKKYITLLRNWEKKLVEF